ncbi:MAG: hypothetical protein AAF533_04995 [Acidobacteriota bacterium]
MSARFLPFFLLPLLACRSADPGVVPVEVPLTWDSRQCLGDNGLAPSSVRRMLVERDLEPIRLDVPAHDVPVCEGCYPACSLRLDYTLVVRASDETTVRELLRRLERPLFDSLQDRETLVLRARSGHAPATVGLVLENHGTDTLVIPDVICPRVPWTSLLTLVVDHRHELRLSYVDLRHLHEHLPLRVRPDDRVRGVVDLGDHLPGLPIHELEELRQGLRWRESLDVHFELRREGLPTIRSDVVTLQGMTLHLLLSRHLGG